MGRRKKNQSIAITTNLPPPPFPFSLTLRFVLIGSNLWQWLALAWLSCLQDFSCFDTELAQVEGCWVNLESNIPFMFSQPNCLVDAIILVVSQICTIIGSGVMPALVSGFSTHLPPEKKKKNWALFSFSAIPACKNKNTCIHNYLSLPTM
jgi:hypothetical protein